MLTTKGHHATTAAAVGAARGAIDQRFRHLYSRKADVGPGDWSRFRGDALVAEWDPLKKSTEISFSVNGDGKTPDKTNRAVICIPPMTGKFTANLEGNAFRRSRPDDPNTWCISRAQAKYRFSMQPGNVSGKLEQSWAENCEVPLKEIHEEFCEQLVAGQQKIMRDAYHLPDPALAPWKQDALKHARNQVKARAAYASMSMPEFAQACKADDKVHKEVVDAAIDHFVENANLQCIQQFTEEGEAKPRRFVFDSKVYKVADYEGGNYNSENKGPSEGELASTLETLPTAISKMANLDGGRDKRLYQAIQYANAKLPPTHKKYHVPRPTIRIGGKTHPDYAWDPLNKSGSGKPLKSWIVAKIAFRIVASKNGYGVQCTLMGQREIAIFHQEKLESEPASQYAEGVGTGMYEDSDDEGAEHEEAAVEQPGQPEKRTRTPETAETAAAPPETAETLAAEPEADDAEDDMDALFS